VTQGTSKKTHCSSEKGKSANNESEMCRASVPPLRKKTLSGDGGDMVHWDKVYTKFRNFLKSSLGTSPDEDSRMQRTFTSGGPPGNGKCRKREESLTSAKSCPEKRPLLERKGGSPRGKPGLLTPPKEGVGNGREDRFRRASTRVRHGTPWGIGFSSKGGGGGRTQGGQEASTSNQKTELGERGISGRENLE